MKLKKNFEIVSIGDETVIVPIGDNVDSQGFIIRLNDSASEILELLKEDITEEEIIDKLDNKYENSREEIEIYVKDLLNTFSEHGVL